MTTQPEITIMANSTKLKLLNNNDERRPDELTPRSIHLRVYKDSPRNRELWPIIFDLCHLYDIKAVDLLRWLIRLHYQETITNQREDSLPNE